MFFLSSWSWRERDPLIRWNKNSVSVFFRGAVRRLRCRSCRPYEKRARRTGTGPSDRIGEVTVLIYRSPTRIFFKVAAISSTGRAAGHRLPPCRGVHACVREMAPVAQGVPALPSRPDRARSSSRCVRRSFRLRIVSPNPSCRQPSAKTFRFAMNRTIIPSSASSSRSHDGA